jgi:hypothetical protein
MVYVDTSVLVAFLVQEARSAAVDAWYAQEPRELVAATWCITEFASALSLKQRTGALQSEAALLAWAGFQRLLAVDLRLLTVEPGCYHRAAELARDAASGLRAGDALHLACAEAAGASHLVTLDEVLARNARRVHIEPLMPSAAD